RIINVPQGEFVMLGALVMVTLVNRGAGPAPAFALTVASVAVFAALLERVAIHPLRAAPPLAAAGAAGTEPGLCVNCEERVYCLRPKPPGGVWHCEEYR
ncbi:MAG: hypothetical protein HY812_17345, partial [Planctomycetes bacterium]|nr:hypothetical protein [Planctomycetota bacterium]